MRVDIITCLPDLIQSPFQSSILKRAQTKKLLDVHWHDLRQYGIGKRRQIDDYAFGGGAGMVMMIEPIANCIQQLRTKRSYDEIIYMSPDGITFDQPIANEISLKKNLIILCGHYKGIDERIRQHLITKEISIGDYVLSGGELAAAVVVDAVVRLIPGVLNDETSALTDTFQDELVAPPIYTRPAEFNDWTVPKILLSGHTKKIEEWRFEQQIVRTKQKRPDLLNKNKK